MTGAGFGGCTVNLVARDVLSKFIAAMHERYFRVRRKSSEPLPSDALPVHPAAAACYVD